MAETAPLWTAAGAAEAAGGTLTGGGTWNATGVSIDSRSLVPGDLFVALKDVRDGHDFVADAFAKGAAAALVTHRPEGVAGPCLEVPDTLEGLRGLAAGRRAETSARICGITGSVGKTGTKEALKLCLAATGPTHAPDKSYNNHFGVPLTLARMPEDSAYAAIEIGMNHAGEITPLSKLTRPHVAIITTVAAVHLEFFDSVAGIADAKAEIFAGLEPGGTAILNRDNAYFDQLCTRAHEAGVSRIVSFGMSPGAHVRLVDFAVDPAGSTLVVNCDGKALKYRVPQPGMHLALNSLAVMAAVHLLGADLDAAQAAYAELQAPEGRGRRHHAPLPGGAGDITVIDESYNANPESMAAAIATLGYLAKENGARSVAVLGDMLELGADGPRFHALLTDALEEARIDLVFCAGPLMASLWAALPESRKGAWTESSEGLIAPLTAALEQKDVVMVKGSLGSAMRPIVDVLIRDSA